ncbi:MAG: DNA repair protein RecN [Verrucomicrobiales bacterium]
MLTTLRIKNLALVDDLTWEVGPGLVGVTGETGAGKSIIVGALKLMLGERADRSLVRTGEECCTVEAVFSLPNAGQVNEVLEESGFDPCEGDELIVKRVISAEGANRQFINCSPATIAALKSVGHFLVDLHGPHEHQSLLSQDRQRAMLDAYANAAKEAAAYAEVYRAWREVAGELDDLVKSEGASAQEIDLLRHQIREIDSAELKSGEEADLEKRYKIASNSTRLIDLTGGVLGLLADADDSILERLGEMARLVRDLEKTDPSTAQLTQGFDAAQVELQEMENSLRDYAADLEIDPAEVAALEARINTIEVLKRKYGRTIDDILDFRAKAEARLAKIEDRGGEIERLEKALAAARERLTAAATELSQKRRAAAPRLAKEISKHLGDLGFKRSFFEVKLQPLDDPAPGGGEEIDFLFGPNPGEPAKPLRLIASSGEMARVMLAVKSALAKQDRTPLLVFDEIDANVGGHIAESVGAKMAELGKSHQVISITHLPQVAALAACHYVVEKEFDKKRTRSVLREVAGDERIEEIARMLGGSAKSAREHARALLGG